ncbi:MAG: alanine racemase [Proteobacteria bacterium]|nr:alanine racemase [Pseudomonadota bacterium]
MTRPARVIVDVAAIVENFKVVQKKAPHARIMAIVKADGYGHGVVRVAKALAGRTDSFGVASLEEAITLREAGINEPIVLLEGPFEASELREIIAYQLDSVIHSEHQLAWFAGVAEKLSVWIKVDSGMHRLGFAPPEIPKVVALLQAGSHSIRFMTHLASAHHPNDRSVGEQVATFHCAIDSYNSETSIANSSAVLSWPTVQAQWVRPGLMLYGVSPFEASVGSDHGLQPVMTVASQLISVREVASGSGVGYGRGYICPTPMRVGVVAFGYGDGYPRNATTGTPIVVAGVRTQVIGQASMDMLTVDLRPIPHAAVGDPVVLWGRELPVEEIARHAATIPYELLCRVRMRARYVEFRK